MGCSRRRVKQTEGERNKRLSYFQAFFAAMVGIARRRNFDRDLKRLNTYIHK